MDEVQALYADASTGTKLFLRGRVLLSDLEFIESYVPVRGTIIDLGCGHGLFANLMALSSPERRVIGVDLSPKKIEQARRTIGNRGNIDFICADITGADFVSAGIPVCDAITLIDVLYLFPRDLQKQMLGICRRQLAERGQLIWKSQERRPRWKFAWTYLQEQIATAVGLTSGRRDGLTFMGREESLDALAEAGFSVRVVEMGRHRPYPDIIFLGE